MILSVFHLNNILQNFTSLTKIFFDLINITNNIFYGTGTLFWLSNAVINNLVFDYNKWYSTRLVGDWGNTGDNIDLFIISDIKKAPADC